MEPTAACARRQRAAVRRHRDALDTDAFVELLDVDDLRQRIDAELPDHRRRIYPPATTLAMFLSQAMSDDGSCQGVVDEHVVRLIAQGRHGPSASTGGYVRARQRLPLALVSSLCKRIGANLSERARRHWRWHGRRTLLVDGTTVSMPDTAANQRVYPQPASQEPGLGFPLARLVGLGCLATGAVLDAALSPCKGKASDEQGRFRLLMNNLVPGDVVLGDAAFENYWAIAELAARGVDAVFEINGSRKLCGRATLVTLRRPSERPAWMTPEQYARVPATMRLRRVRAGRKGGEKKTLLTTMIDTRAVSNRSIGQLYRRRWEIELDFRSIKQSLAMEVLGGKAPTMVAKEIWVHLLAYNLIRTVMAQAADRHGREPRSVSFRHAQQMWSAWRRRGAASDAASMDALYAALVRIRVGHRPGRREPRAIKRRPRPHRLMATPRAQARRECERYEKR